LPGLNTCGTGAATSSARTWVSPLPFLRACVSEDCRCPGEVQDRQIGLIRVLLTFGRPCLNSCCLIASATMIKQELEIHHFASASDKNLREVLHFGPDREPSSARSGHESERGGLHLFPASSAFERAASRGTARGPVVFGTLALWGARLRPCVTGTNLALTSCRAWIILLSCSLRPRGGQFGCLPP